MSGFIDYYELLEVSPRASCEVIELAYKAIAKKYHPDLNDISKRDFYNIKMALINEARSVLTDTYKRNQYDDKYRSQKIRYADQSQSNRTNTSSTSNDSKPEQDQKSNSNSYQTAGQKDARHSSNQNKRKAKVTFKKEGNAFEYISVPFVIYLIIIVVAVGIFIGKMLSNSFSVSTLNTDSNANGKSTSYATGHSTSNSNNNSIGEIAEIPKATDSIKSIAASDTAEYIKENIVSISEFSWGKNDSGSIEFDIDFRNNSSKTIDSITMKIVILDQDKNILASTDNGSTSANLLLPGPIEPNEIGGLGKYWNNAFTNTNAVTCYIDSINIAYADRTSYKFSARTKNIFE